MIMVQNTNMRRPKGILFDLGDTLLTYEGMDPLSGTEHVLQFAENPRGLSARDVQDLVAELWEDLEARRDASMLELRSDWVHRLVYEAHGITFSLSQEEVELEFFKTSMKFTREPEIESTLQALTRMELPMAIVSNATFSGRTLSSELERQGLADYFEFLMSSADYGVSKPHPLIMQTAAAKLGLEPKDVWYVGNSLKYDVRGAKSAGMTGVWYNRVGDPNDGVEPDAVVLGWKEFLAIVQAFY